MSENESFQVGQKAFIEKDGKVLVMFNSHGLDFPGGRIQKGELKNEDLSTLSDSLKREVKEETSLEIDILEPFFTWFYEFPNHQMVYLVGFRCKYISGEVKISDEHYKFEWAGKDTYRNLKENSNYFLALEKYFKK